MTTPAVLHVAQPVEYGVGHAVADLAAAQRAAGMRVAVACPEGWLRRAVRDSGVEVLPWAAVRAPGGTLPEETLRLAGVIRRAAPDVVHLHSAKAGLAGRLALRGRLPTVFTPHAWSFHAVSGVLRAAAVRWERAGLTWTTRLVCLSEGERAEAELEGIDAGDRLEVVPNGVDLGHHRPRDRGKERAALRLDDAPLAVCLGRLWEQKGQDLLLDAWPLVRAALPDAVLLLVGDGPMEASLRARAGQGVRFAGPTGDPRPWIGAADVVVVPSRREGMALVPLEAAAGARSIVMTRVNGATESVTEGMGALVPVGDLPALAREIVKRLRDPALARREGVHGRLHVAAHLSLERTRRLLDDVYARAISGHRDGTAHGAGAAVTATAPQGGRRARS